MVTTVPDTLQAFLLPFAKHFRAQNWQVDAMAKGVSTCNECLNVFDRVWDVEWSRHPLDPRNLLVAVPKIQEIAAQGNYDLVHVHTPVAAFVTRYALKNYRAKKQLRVIYTAHGFHFYQGGNPIKNSIFLSLEKLAGAWTDYLITINHEDEAAAKKHRLLSPERIYYTPGIGVDTDYYHSDRLSTAEIATVKDELNLAPTDALLLCIAEFIPRKRHSDILKALKHLNRPDIHLALAGSGILQPELKQLTAELDLQRQVHFLGLRDDIPRLISASNATLLTSQQEGLPRSVMESLCLATPVIGTNIRGIKDLLVDNCGLLVQVGDIKTLAQAIAWIVDRPDKANQMGQRGQIKMAEYDLQHIIQSYEGIYNLALNTNI